MMRVLFTLICLSVLCACGGNPDQQATLTLLNMTAETQIAQVRQTATLGADRMRITVEYLQTRAAFEEDRRDSILSTLDTFGIDMSAINLITPVILTATPVLNQDTMALGGSGGGITRAAPTQIFRTAEVTPTPLPLPTIDPNAPNLTETSVSTSVGSNDCATGITAQFSETSAMIYAVGTANNFVPGTTVTFNWLREGAVVFSDSFTWDFAIDGRCIWYFVTSDEFVFTPGNYTVAFESNGVPIGTPITFTITSP